MKKLIAVSIALLSLFTFSTPTKAAPLRLKEDVVMLGKLNVQGAITVTAPGTHLGFTQIEQVGLSPNTGTAANTTVYQGAVYFGRACTITKIWYATDVATVSGTNVITVANGANNLLSTTNISLNTATINTANAATLTATTANLSIPAGSEILCTYTAGTQGAAAKNVKVIIEAVPNAF